MKSLVSRFRQIRFLAFPVGSVLFASLSWAAPAPAPIAAAYGKLPLRFEQNRGQAAPEVAYLSRGRGYTLYLTGTEAVMTLRGHGRASKAAVLRMAMVGAKAHAAVAGEDVLQGKVNYLTGNDRTRWQTGVPTYRRVRYDDVWPGVDLVWHGTRSALEYDFVVAPGADPSRIRLRFDGAQRLRVDAAGDLVVTTAAGDLVQQAPVLYQEGANGRTPVHGTYVLRGKRQVAFRIGAYDTTRPLVIDPVLAYATYLGGTLDDEALGIAVDAQGQAYVTGTTESNRNGFPQRGSLNVGITPFLVFVTKLNATGTDVIYSSLIGSTILGHDKCTADDYCDVIATGIAITADGKAAITGGVNNTFNDSEFPITGNAYQGSGIHCGGVCPIRGERNRDAFVTLLSADGTTLLYSTFYGGASLGSIESGHGDDRGEAIAIDARERIYITGSTVSNDLPIRNGFQRKRASSFNGVDAFVAVFDPNQAKGNDTLLYASFLGGKDDDMGFGIATDGDGNAYAVGTTRSTDLKTKSPSGQALPPLQSTFRGGSFDGFVAKIDTGAKDDSSLTYLTYFGGANNDRVESVAVDSFQRTYFTGATRSEANSFPLLNAFDSTQRNGEAFVAKMNADGTALFYCSFLGGNNDNTSEDFEEGMGIAIDADGNAFVAGNTSSGDTFPTGVLDTPLPAEQQGTAFLAKIEASTSATVTPQVLSSTTFGGKGTKALAIALDPSGSAYLTGVTTGELPTTTGTFQPAFGGERDAFVARITAAPTDTTGLYRIGTHEFLLRNLNTTGGPDLTVLLGIDGDLPVAGDWDGDGETDIGVYRPLTGQFLLRLRNGSDFAITTLSFGGSDDTPVAGDWDGDGFDTVGVFRFDAKGMFFALTNSHVADEPAPELELQYFVGLPGDLPLAGDWDGDGLDTVGIYRPSNSTFFLANSFDAAPDVELAFGITGDLPLAGDWNGDGTDGVGIFRNSENRMHLTNDFGVTALIFGFAARGADFPLGGNWDGQ